jgi:hypothetical protein
MTANRDWTYYALGTPPKYIRYRPVEAQALNVRELRWVDVDGKVISRYIENGEMDLDEITRAAIEQRLSATIPA